ncbi:release factor glutamine methyltransferase [Diaminobutyricimonas aerilata]|uniref:peptide chain release factor N(5)-glutamine methyltransferase n=1 Tax=Diaminobutyricimonas aerilata TaxID=1162967 RepID=A0A2M9CJW8_9MICO|nr:putative protein N(5)-glutamine methyltransferase [Diaminobutyricimonas aerilata]PJJ72193.1 release factor glutamine methyltransferase [Diaminobutyricimonas aerilata]
MRAAGCVFAEDEAALLAAEARSDEEFERMLRERVDGRPLEIVVGWAGFDGLRVIVDEQVFVPRRRTELLVELAAEHGGRVVVDLCCGSGAIGLALARRLPGLELHAADIHPAAVSTARRNLAGIGEVHEGDLFDALPRRLRGKIDLLAVNAPYVPTRAIADMPPEARNHEPLVTLDGGADGLDLHRRVAAEAGSWLAPGAALLIECGEPQAAASAALFAARGFTARIEHDEDRAATVVVAIAP